MTRKQLHRIVTVVIASVWVVFGLVCKVLNLVPRHEEIVARILGEVHAGSITRIIGMLEILMALWILSGFKKRLNAIVQIATVGTMNLLEGVLASDLLLWGHFNLFFAAVFIWIIHVNEWVLNTRARE